MIKELIEKLYEEHKKFPIAESEEINDIFLELFKEIERLGL